MTKCYIRDYPRPQFVRKEWENLNGTWDFAFDDGDAGEGERWYESFRGFDGGLRIQVPFPYETRLSGIGDETRHDNVWYHRSIVIDDRELMGHRYIIHFEGSDFVTKLWVNGRYAGSHRGGYARFSFDITDLVTAGENHLTVKAEDSFDMQQPRGKQRWGDKSYGCWYVQTTGIWKTVWAEYVPEISLSWVKMTPNLPTSSLKLEFGIEAPEGRYGCGLMVETRVSYEGSLVNRSFTAAVAGHVSASIDLSRQAPEGFVHHARNWSPRKPCLYDIAFRLVENGEVLDEVGSYFAMREIRIDGSQVLLNGMPLYQRLVLDQGYWKDSCLTPPDEDALVEDIDKILSLGYNGLRLHQKTEDERFLYWCDVKGVLVWGEAPAAYTYSDDAVREFVTEWMEIVRQFYNHPCIVTWVPFNESWGISQVKTRRDQQHFTEAVYHLTKSMDPYRPVVANDGWEHTVSDILTLHDYEEAGALLKARYTEHGEEILQGKMSHNGEFSSLAEGYAYQGQPVIISEFGGIAFDAEGGGWGYGGRVRSREAFLRRLDSITTAIKEIPYVCGFCYTQLADVQQEMNGLMDEGRNFKAEPEAIREINLRRAGYRKEKY